MADYVYLLETRLSSQQRAALSTVRDVARNHDLTIFLVGGAVRDLISGAPVRDLDVAVQGNALKLRKDLEKAGGEFSAENAGMQQLHFRFPGGVRLEVGSTLNVSFPKPGRPVVKPATILEDLRRRDFTANSMALSLNEGSFGLLMDPLNGVADIENRELRLVSPYGFIEDPVRLMRAARLMARLGWSLDERTRGRYENAKEENYIGALSAGDRAYEVEEVFHEEDPLRVMQRLEEEGWLKELSPVLSASKANTAELDRLRDVQAQLYEQAVQADAAAANFPLLTAKLAAKDVQVLKDSFPRKGFVREIDSLDSRSKEFITQLTGKQAALPSQAFQLITSSAPAVVLWAAFSSKNAAAQAKFKSFYKDWPQNRQRIPYLLMQEMRITPDLPQYNELLQKLFFALMDEKLETPEALRAFLEPYSPPAPPPPVNLRRPRAAKGPKRESRAGKSRKRAQEEEQGTTTEVVASAEAAPGSSTAPVTPAGKPAQPAAEPPAKAPPAGAKHAKEKPQPDAKVRAKNVPVKTPETKPAASSRSAKPSVKTKAQSAKSQPVAKKSVAKKAARPPLKSQTPAKRQAKKQLATRTGSKPLPAARGSARTQAAARPGTKNAKRTAPRSGARRSAPVSRAQLKKRPAAKRPKR